MLTYPFPAVMAGDVENMVSGIEDNKAKRHIQNVVTPDYPEGRATMMKYIKINPLISINEDKNNGSGAKIGGYGIVDASRPFKTTLSRWYVEYKFENNDDKRIKKLKKKIADRAEEFGLYKNETDFYTDDQGAVYMLIVDLEKYFGKK